ncbi:MAG: type II secretion system protein [Deltaproteobacteria bacterium]|nr:type II secretion system protein [Deltaproteobacteria bacterium]MBW1849419.1 type II secretion system protein [Deltaproteobacteria bacterium]MBW2180943.1 type II secretion system protein [Deltaproteobacteria bacterium]
MLKKCLKGLDGYTIIELMVVLGVISILIALAGVYVLQAKKQAYKITSKYDLTHFAKVEEEYYVQNYRFAGSSGQSVRNDGIESDFVLKGFSPTIGVCVTIISGDPEDPFNSSNPFIAQSKHNGVNSLFEFNFTTREMVEK